MTKLLKKHSEIQQLILKRSPFEENRTGQLLAKYFKSIPRSVKLLVKNHEFDKKKVLEIGCGFGQTLFYWRQDSEGIDIGPEQVEFVRAIGRKVHVLNVENGFKCLEAESFDAIYTNNLIEHLVAPHLFLARLHSLLNRGGILAIGCPAVPPSLIRILWGSLGYRGWLAVEHINFFTPHTVKLTLERAGFEVQQQYDPGFSRIHPVLSKLCLPVGLHVLSVCQKVDQFKYNPKRGSNFDPSWAGELLHFREDVV